MTSRKLLLDNLEMCNHDRVPRDLWTLPWYTKRYSKETSALLKDFPLDMTTVPAFGNKRGIGRGDMYLSGTATDDWGCEFVNIHEGVIGEVKNPQIVSDDWDDTDKIHFPTEWLSLDYDQINAFCANTDQFVKGDCCPKPFEQLQFLRGTVNLYMDLMDPPPAMLRFIEKMHAFYCEQMELWVKTDIDALMMADDWGSQQSLLIPPRVWREIFKPMYKDYIDIAHRAGKKMLMHSDGNTLEIIPDLIELGLDAINTQIFCIGVEKLAPFKGKITFWGEIDRQHLLPNGTLDEIDSAVHLVRDTLWDNGGCIAQMEAGPGTNPANVRQAFTSWAN